MEHIENILTEASTDEQASPPASRSAACLARHSARLGESLIEDMPPMGGADRRQRGDGWTQERMRRFLEVLSQCGVVGDAARAAGMSRQKAYAFRNSARGQAFDFAWRTALIRARGRLTDEVMSRALNGCVDVIVRDGKVWGERHRYDNRLTMAVLTRLDQIATPKYKREEMPAVIAPEFEELLDKVCEGGPRETADFIRARCDPTYTVIDDSEFLHRAEDYLHTGSGLPQAEAADAEEEAPSGDDDWIDLLDDEPEADSSDAEPLTKEDPSSVALAKEEESTNGSCHLRHLDANFPLDFNEPTNGQEDDPQPPTSSIPPRACLGEGDREAVEGLSPAAAGDEQTRPAPVMATDVPGTSPPALDHPKQLEGASAQPDPPTQSPEQAEPEVQWILGDDGIAIKLVNGRLPPHLRHRYRSMKF